MNSDSAVVALTALAQSSRLAIFRLLVTPRSAGISAGKIGQELSLPAATLSFHLKELSHAGLIQGTQEGKFVFYRVNFSQMNALLAFLAEHCCQGSGTDCEVSIPACTTSPPAA